MKSYRVLFYALMGTLMVSCASNIVKEDISSSVKKDESSQHVKEWPKTIEPQLLNIRPGEVSLLVVPGTFNRAGSLKCGGKDYKFYLADNKLVSFISETYFSKEKPFSCFFFLKGEKAKVADIKTLSKKFPSERLKVDKKRVFLNKKDAARARKESKIRAKAYASSPDRPLFFEPFSHPIKSFVTSIYGSKRVFNKKKQTQHLGTDYRAAVGVPIKAANRGEIVISRNFFYTGNTIIIDHGLGIFTMYGHLSKLHVQEGEIVPMGSVIGLAGSTGRVTGPHLHWGVTVNGLAIEGDSLVEASKGLPR